MQNDSLLMDITKQQREQTSLETPLQPCQKQLPSLLAQFDQLSDTIQQLKRDLLQQEQHHYSQRKRFNLVINQLQLQIQEEEMKLEDIVTRNQEIISHKEEELKKINKHVKYIEHSIDSEPCMTKSLKKIMEEDKDIYDNIQSSIRRTKNDRWNLKRKIQQEEVKAHALQEETIPIHQSLEEQIVELEEKLICTAEYSEDFKEIRNRYQKNRRDGNILQEEEQLIMSLQKEIAETVLFSQEKNYRTPIIRPGKGISEEERQRRQEELKKEEELRFLRDTRISELRVQNMELREQSQLLSEEMAERRRARDRQIEAEELAIQNLLEEIGALKMKE